MRAEDDNTDNQSQQRKIQHCLLFEAAVQEKYCQREQSSNKDFAVMSRRHQRYQQAGEHVPQSRQCGCDSTETKPPGGEKHEDTGKQNMKDQVNAEHSVKIAEKFQNRKRIEDIAVKGVNVRHPPKNERIPHRHLTVGFEILNIEMSKEDSGVYCVGTVEHLIGKDKLAKYKYYPNQHHGQQDRQIVLEIFKIRRRWGFL